MTSAQPDHRNFYSYYAQASATQETLQRFLGIRERILRLLPNGQTRILDVADVGCGAGTQSMVWAQLGHRVHGIDINESLLKLAKDRASEAGCSIDFLIGSASALPWPEQSMDVCLVPEVIEHVVEWRDCLSEFARVLRPGGFLYLSTTNKLCPRQQEFDLPLYSWYPKILKRYFERLAVTTRPELVNFAKYPAVNWLSFYQLRSILVGLGFCCSDRFDLVDLSKKNLFSRGIIHSIRTMPPLRLLAHVATPSTIVVARKRVQPDGKWLMRDRSA